MPARASIVDPGRQAVADVEQARALLLSVADLIRVATPLQAGAPPDAHAIRVERLCDELASKLTLRYPHARRPAARLVLP
jgi:hypothetical protein